jgi:hypothetical protein
MRIIAMFALAAVLVGCSALGTPGQAQMCEAAGSLSAAGSLVEQAATKDGSGDRSGAQALAAQAAALAGRGHDALQAVDSGDVKRGKTWQALLDAYLHIGQVANALLPGYEGTYGITAEELATGTQSLRAAAAGLPPACLTATPTP